MRLTDADIERLAAFLELTVEQFVETYTQLPPQRNALALTEQATGACVFLTPDNRCRVQPVKPIQCVRFPNEWRFPGFDQLCQAEELPPDLSSAPKGRPNRSPGSAQRSPGSTEEKSRVR